MRTSVSCLIGAAGVVIAGLTSPASADDLNSIVRNLNGVLNPGDAQRLEEQSRRNGRMDEERYWHNYREGLEEQHRRPQYGERIGPEQAQRLEEQARRNGRRDEERYWHRYWAGYEGEPRREAVPSYREEERYSERRIGPQQASRLEEQARQNGRWDEVRYWHNYREGLEERR